MRRLQDAGHRPIAVVGGATGLIGDPSGKDAERALNEVAVVEGWVERIRRQVEGILAFDGANAAQIVNNLEWTAGMPALTFLRDVGKHFSVARMLAKEAVSARLDTAGISYTEFSYQILQAMDYLELHRRYGCILQTGGSDQWGNLTAGVDLIRRAEGATVHALATPLITRSDGRKYGKTESGAVFLDPEMTSPFAFYQYFLNQDDADIVALLKVFSFRSRGGTDGIEALAAATEHHPEARDAQRVLAAELTALVHGDDESARAVAASEALFGSGDLTVLDVRTLEAAAAELPHAAMSEEATILDLLVSSGLASSRGDARRTVSEGGAYLNNHRVGDPAFAPGPSDFLHGRWALLRRGKRQLAVIERGR
jgi:tyrosyl-tRNA synthetase